ncbi:MAG: EF-P lysine aminoacylase GenX [Gammaproteobacteria bacterium]|nr:EF-P lysine aminoacylase GenX [Gammaproteobacteria bacterium]
MSDCQNKGWSTKASDDVLLKRALMLKGIRSFFDANDVIEVETPLLSHYQTTDPHLDSLQSRFRDEVCFLNTSPEYAMKRLLASWKRPIYQICKAFRDDELGPNHNPEFTLLEWHRPGFDMQQLMAEVADLVKMLWPLANASDNGTPVFKSMSYQQAFEDFVGINPHQVTSLQCYQAAKAKNVDIPCGLTTDSYELNAWLDWLLTQLVLPAFDQSTFTFLYDYPAAQCSLAKVAMNEQQILVARRFELFYGQIELANGFHELTDADEQHRRFKLENTVRKHSGKRCARIDDNFIAALQFGLPECSGVAIGLDRLLMAVTQTPNIEHVLSFSWKRS